ncbi:MAG TPA: PBSX family phage terminase large subunit [Tissierellaceae bacterium]|nr:PBSX family phage terminase large subunit [Tissierellaceae bacterium]
MADLVTKKSLPKLIGKGYKQFWNHKGRYRVLKGGRGSKKSTTASFWFPYNMMKYWHSYGLRPCTLVIRRYYNTHRDSTFAQLKWAINRMDVSHLWKATKSPLELTYIPSGQKIMFRGLDDPQSITSITVEDGELCWVWWEEAFQITMEDDFNKVDMSIRGEMPAPLFKQHTLTFNPWSEKIWIKKAFFDKVGTDGLSKEGDILAVTKNYDCNEFLGDDDRRIFEKMKEENPRRYSIEGEGNWGIAEGLVFENWQELEFDVEYLKRQLDREDNPRYRQLHGLDFGYTNDPTAFIALLADEKEKKLFIYDEVSKTHMKNRDIHSTLKYKGFERVRICADSEDPRTIDELKDLGLYRMFGAKKGKGSVKAGIQKLQDYKIYVHPSCVNTIVELSNYVWATDKDTGKPSTDPIDEYNHLMDALRYATEELNSTNFSW